jgi:hypothetical protein
MPSGSDALDDGLVRQDLPLPIVDGGHTTSIILPTPSGLFREKQNRLQFHLTMNGLPSGT